MSASWRMLDNKIKEFILDLVLGLKAISIGGLKVQNDIWAQHLTNRRKIWKKRNYQDKVNN